MMKFYIKIMSCTFVATFIMLSTFMIGQGYGAYLGGGSIQNFIGTTGNTVGGTYGSGRGQISVNNNYNLTIELAENTSGLPPEITYSNFNMDLGSLTLENTGQYFEVGSLSNSHTITTTLNIDSFNFTIGNHGPYQLQHEGGTIFGAPIIHLHSSDGISSLVTGHITGSYSIYGETETLSRNFDFSFDNIYGYDIWSKYDVFNFPESVDLVYLSTVLDFDLLNIFTENIDGCELSFGLFGSPRVLISEDDEPLTLTANSQVPIPSSFILLGSSFLGLVAIKSRKRKS